MTAVLAFNDLVAIGAFQAARRLGVAIPTECALVGFDGLSIGELIDPPLTTIGLDKRRLGELAVQQLDQLLAGEQPAPACSAHTWWYAARPEHHQHSSGETMEIWINPECSKCQSALGLLDAAGTEYTVRRYLEQPPTTSELDEVLARLQLDPWHIARLGEPVADELGLKDWPREDAARSRWLDALVRHPELIQRPIITTDDGGAAIARTPEAVQAVLTPRDAAAPDPSGHAT